MDHRLRNIARVFSDGRKQAFRIDFDGVALVSADEIVGRIFGLGDGVEGLGF